MKELISHMGQILAKKWIVKINKILMVVMIFHMHTLLCILNTLVQNHECRKCLNKLLHEQLWYVPLHEWFCTCGENLRLQIPNSINTNKNYNHKRKGEQFYYLHMQSLNKNNTWSHIKDSRITMKLSKL